MSSTACQESDHGRAIQRPGPSVFWFAIKFPILAFLLTAAMHVDELAWDGAVSSTLCKSAARAVAAILTACTGDGRSEGAFVHYRGTVIGVVPECIGIEIFGFFLVAVLAFPAPWRSRGRIIALGVPFLVVANGFRLTTLVYAAPRWPEIFGVAHLYVWPLIMLAITLALFMQWVRGLTIAGR